MSSPITACHILKLLLEALNVSRWQDAENELDYE